jgi:CHAD domain-containing protein
LSKADRGYALAFDAVPQVTRAERSAISAKHCARHELRVTLKKLRYATEFFLPVFAGQASAKRYVARLSKLQDALGHANDSTAMQSLLNVAVQAAPTPDVHRAAGALIGWVARDQLAVAKSLRKRWRQFKATPGFWRSTLGANMAPR